MYNFTPVFLLFFVMSCGEGSDGPNQPEPNELPTISVSDASSSERENGRLDFSISIVGEFTSAIEFDYTVEGITATPSEDFTTLTGTFKIEPGQNNNSIAIDIVDDEEKELDEKIRITLANPKQVKIDDSSAIGIIKDNDDLSNFDDQGYLTKDSHYGYNLSWSDEFEGGEISEADYTFETGDGCPNLCGWGNNELQKYTSEVKNIRIEDGKLRISALEDTPNNYSSARMITKGKQSFRFGRIDIRAKLPYGQGLWPALWMLGSNIDDRGWPSCGEIDIMEMVGHVPDEVLGTAHWGTSPGPSTFKTGKKRNTADYSEAFHVFTMDWTAEEMNWYVDEQKFHTITSAELGGAANPFINEFFFIFNIAIGGNLPGAPDASTTFPQVMEIDYVRVFQLTQ